MKKFKTFLEDKVAVFHHDTQLQNVKMKETGVKRRKNPLAKDPRPTDHSRPSLKIHEEDEQHIYHVTHTKHVAAIQKNGIMPMKTSNWVQAGNKERYGGGEVYAFTHKADAEKWAGRMDWAHHQKLGSGKISIITAKRPSDRKFEVDHNDPLSQAGKSGDWLKTHGSIEPHHIISVEPYKPRKLAESKVAEKIKAHPAVEYYGGKNDDHFINLKKGWHMGDGQRSFGSENAAAALKTLKQVRQFKPGEAKEYGLDEAKDRIGKSTPSAEEIAKKHNKEVAEIQAQIDKGIKVEREHTDSDAEAHEIARDHLDEFPDYYDRLDKMEKKAKKDINESDPLTFAQMGHQLAVGGAIGAVYAGVGLPSIIKIKKMMKARKEANKNKLKSSKTVTVEAVKKPDPMYPKQELPPKKPHPVPKGYERVKDGKFNVLRKIKESYNPEKEQLKNRIEAHSNKAQMMEKEYGKDSREAAFHRALVKRYQKELGEEFNPIDEETTTKAKKQTRKDWTKKAANALKKNDYRSISKALRAHANLYNKKVVKEGSNIIVSYGGKSHISSASIKRALALKDIQRKLDDDSIKQRKTQAQAGTLASKNVVKEDGAVPNSVGGGNIAGMPTYDTGDTSVARPLGKMARRKKFAGKQVFVVDPTTYHKAYLGKRKYEHYEKYLEGCDIADEIREFGRTNWAEPIIIENEQTGAMVYLKYGSK